MAADPSIYNALMAPRKSAFDYANELEDQAYQREQRGTQRQMNALQLQQAQQSQADDQAYREAARGFGADTDANANMLLQRGLAKQAMQYRKDALEGTKTKSEIQLNASKSQEQQASAAEKQFKLEQDRRQKHLQELVGVNDVQSAHAWLDQAAASGELPPDKVAQVKAQLQANPNMLQQWKQGAIAGGFTLQQQRENEWKQREFGLKQNNELIGENGQLNQPLLNAKKQVAQAGKTSVNLNVNTAKNLTGEIAQGLGKQLDASLAGANAAVSTINTAGQIRDLVNSGKVITGPGADTRVTMARIGDLLGVGGKDNAEKLANTATLVQSLAKNELDAAQSMKGQGQITEAEREILRKAAAGQLNMSRPELISLSNALEKTARGRIAAHKTQVERLKSVDGGAPLIPFYSVEEPAARGAPQAPGVPPDIAEILKKHGGKGK